MGEIYASLLWLKIGVPVYQGTVQVNCFGTALGTMNIIVVCQAFRNLVQKSVFDGGALLTEGVTQRVDKSLNAGFCLSSIVVDGKLTVYAQQLFLVHIEVFQATTFRVLQHPQKEGLWQLAHLDFLVVVSQENPVVIRDFDAAQFDSLLEPGLNHFYREILHNKCRYLTLYVLSQFLDFRICAIGVLFSG